MSLTPTTLQQIITDCRRRIDMRVSQFWTDTDFTTEINKSLSQLDMVLVSKFNDYKLTEKLTTPTTDPVTGAQNLIALPADFLKLRGLDIQYVNTNNVDAYIRCMPFNFKQRNTKPYPIVGPSVFTPFQILYRLQGANIYLLPASAAGQFTYRIWYTPDFIPLVNPTDTLQSYMDSQAWYEYAVLDVCAKCQASQDLPTEPFMAQKEELKTMIVSLSAPNRDAGDPVFVQDGDRGWGDGGGYGYW